MQPDQPTDDEVLNLNAEEHAIAIFQPTAFNITFIHGTREVGKLELNDEGELIFTGDAEASAEKLFDLVCAHFNSWKEQQP